MKYLYLLVMIVSLSLTGCKLPGDTSDETEANFGGGGDSQTESAATSSGGSHGGSNEQVNAIVNVPTTVGIKNFDQIDASMSVLTGVSRFDNNVRNDFLRYRTAMPLDNDVRSLTADHQGAIAKLAARYCDRMISNGALRASRMGGFNTGLRPDRGAFSAANRSLLINSLVESFWSAPIEESMDPVGTANELNSLIDTLLAGSNMSSTATTRNVSIGICTTVLASSKVLLY